MPNINDLRYSFYGGGQDAEISFLQSMSDASLTAADAMRVTYGQVSARRTGALAETYSRRGIPIGNTAVLLSARLQLCAIPLTKGQVITSATFVSATTPASGPTNQWFALYSPSLVKLRVTNDDTNTAWAASTAKTLAFTTSYTVTATGLYYLGICVVAGTVPTLQGVGPTSAINALTPILNGSSSTGLTDPASAPDPAAITGNGVAPYAYVS